MWGGLDAYIYMTVGGTRSVLCGEDLLLIYTYECGGRQKCLGACMYIYIHIYTYIIQYIVGHHKCMTCLVVRGLVSSMQV